MLIKRLKHTNIVKPKRVVSIWNVVCSVRWRQEAISIFELGADYTDSGCRNLVNLVENYDLEVSLDISLNIGLSECFKLSTIYVAR